MFLSEGRPFINNYQTLFCNLLSQFPAYISLLIAKTEIGMLLEIIDLDGR